MSGSRPLDAEAWARVTDLFERALGTPADRRAAFLNEACRDRPELRAEVLSLLAAHESHRARAFDRAPADLSRLVAAADPLVGRTVGQYRIERVLGRGGMGVVYLAADLRLGRLVAFKALAPEATSDPVRQERLRREARAAALVGHPGIATVFALEELDGHLYIASEYVEGESLRERLRRGPLAPQAVLDIALQAARALAAAHERGIVHRDIKPENLLLSTTGQLKILDLGVARVDGAPSALPNLTGDGSAVGTPPYMAPEQIRGRAADARSDLFSLGLVLYELLAGVHPFAGSGAEATIARLIEAEPEPLSPRVPAGLATADSLPGLESVIQRMLEKDPAARFQSAAELEAALAGLTSGSVLARRTRRQHPFWWWQVHQAIASVAYALLLFPLWAVTRYVPGTPGMVIVLTALVAAIVAVTLRLHVWFLVRAYPGDVADGHDRARLWTRLADWLFTGTLAAGAIAVSGEGPVLAPVLLGAAVLVLLAFAIIEPATTRAAFPPSHR